MIAYGIAGSSSQYPRVQRAVPPMCRPDSMYGGSCATGGSAAAGVGPAVVGETGAPAQVTGGFGDARRRTRATSTATALRAAASSRLAAARSEEAACAGAHSSAANASSANQNVRACP